jgi:hypothetical protein
MPSELSGAPFPFKIVFGIEAAVRPAALIADCEVEVVRIAIVNRTATREIFTGYLQVWDVFQV